MRFFEAEDLFAQSEDVGAVWVRGRCGEVRAVVDRVNPGERILLRKDMVNAKRAEIFADRLEGGC